MKKILQSILILSLFLYSGYLNAAPFTVNDLTFSEVGAGVILTDAQAVGSSGVHIWETVSALDITIMIEGLTTFGNPGDIGLHTNGFWLTKTVLNNTGQTWDFYDHELQSVFGVASSNGDGLSFAQGTASARPWVSDQFSFYDEVVDVRDYINYFGGTVLDGESVTFTYAITHNGRSEPIYLRQRPDFSTAPVPEPSTMILFGIGLLGLANLTRKKQNKF